MSQLYVDNIKGRTGGAINTPSGIVCAGVGTFSGNVSVGGTLTYDDVTNIDSVGIITAQAGIHVTGGKILAGHTVDISGGGLQVSGNANDGNAGFHRFDANDSGPFIQLLKSRNGTVGGNTVVQADDELGTLNFQGADGTDFHSAARVISKVDGTPGNNDMPGRLEFHTTSDGASSPTERFRITSAGKIGINETSPDQLLHIKNNAAAGLSAAIKLESSGTSNSANDTMGRIEFAHSDSNDAGVSASIVCRAEDTVGNTYVQFNNGNPSASTERLRIASAGQIGLGGANYGTAGQAIVSNGSGSAPTWQDVASGVTTTASSPSANSVVTLNLSTAVHHELTLSAGITTITVSGGVYGESHSVVINQPSSGIATVGFSTHFFFPSGATPSMSEGSSKVDLVSFVVKKVEASGTELLASAGLNYSN